MNSGDLFFLHSDGVALRSPKASLKESSGPYELIEDVLQSIEHGDDATFIAGSLFSKLEVGFFKWSSVYSGVRPELFC